MKIKSFLLLFLLGFFLARPVFSDTPVTSLALENRLTALAIEEQDSALLNCVLFFRVGLMEESRFSRGLCDLTARCINRELSDYLTTGGESLEEKGIEFQSLSEPDFTAFSFRAQPENLALIFEVISHLLEGSWLNPDLFAREKAARLAEFSDSGGYDLYDIFKANFYRYHPYRENQGGYRSSLEKLEFLKLKDFYSTLYTPRRCLISLAGKLDRSKIKPLLKDYFAAFPPGPELPLIIEWEPETREKELYLSAFSDQGFVFLGFPAPGAYSEDYYAMRIISVYLGEGLSSRMWVELREKNALAYSLGADYPYLRGPAHLLLQVQTSPDYVRKADKILFTLIKELKNQGINLNGLLSAKNYLRGESLRRTESSAGKAWYYGRAQLLGSGFYQEQNFTARIQQVSPEEIQRVARKYLNEYTLILVNSGWIFFR